ncbi:hypothetical protein ES703_44178 [subsurface metagenome]
MMTLKAPTKYIQNPIYLAIYFPVSVSVLPLGSLLLRLPSVSHNPLILLEITRHV